METGEKTEKQEEKEEPNTTEGNALAVTDRILQSTENKEADFSCIPNWQTH